MSQRSDALEKLLISAVQHLAQEGEQALAHKAQRAHRPDELALEFDDAYTEYVASLDALPTDEQLSSLQSLDTALTAMSGPDNAALWSEDAFREHPRWAEVRSLADAVLVRFGWPTPS